MADQPKLGPVAVSFSPRWLKCHAGLDFSEASWADPIDRVERGREGERCVYDRFADVGLGSKDPQPAPNVGAYGNYFMPALFGCEILFPPDQAPGFRALPGDFEDMRRLQVPDFDTNPVIQRALAEAEVLKRRYGTCSGWIDTGSPLNIAVNIYGEMFVMACALEPETAQHVLRVTAETSFKLYREVCARIAPDDFPLQDIPWGYGNCPAVMFSPKTYREVILPVDKWVRGQVASFGLHHCGVFDDYIEVYKELQPSALDIGGGTNYKAVREAFPNIPFSLIVNAPYVEGKSVSEIDTLIGGMIEGASPVEQISVLWCAEVNESIEDDTVRAVRTAVERVS